MGIQSAFRPFWLNALISFLLGVFGCAVGLSLNRLAMEDGDVGHLAARSLWWSWLPAIFFGGLAIGLVRAWAMSRAATRHRQATPGLSDSERVVAAKAVTRGPVPSEPAVRAAARTFAGGFLARSRRHPWLLGGVGLLWVLTSVMYVVDGDLYIFIFYAALGLVFLVLAWWQWQTRKRVEARWAVLAPSPAA